jgi:hypothetical protein
MRNLVVLYLIVFGLFFVAGLVLLLLDIDLDRADLWLDDHAELFDAVGSRVFNVLWGVVLALCAVTVLGGLWQKFVGPRSHLGDAADFVVEPVADFGVEPAAEDELVEEPPKPVGWGCMVAALIVGYFAWFGMTG